MEITNYPKNNNNFKVFGIIGIIIGSFSLIFSMIPCIGSYAIAPALLASIFCLISFLGSKQIGKPTALPLAGLIIGLVALSIGIYQYINYKEVFDAKQNFDKKLNDALEEKMWEAMENPNDSIVILDPDSTEYVDSTNATEGGY